MDRRDSVAKRKDLGGIEQVGLDDAGQVGEREYFVGKREAEDFAHEGAAVLGAGEQSGIELGLELGIGEEVGVLHAGGEIASGTGDDIALDEHAGLEGDVAAGVDG